MKRSLGHLGKHNNEWPLTSLPMSAIQRLSRRSTRLICQCCCNQNVVVVCIRVVFNCCLATAATVTMPTRKTISYSKTSLGCDLKATTAWMKPRLERNDCIGRVGLDVSLRVSFSWATSWPCSAAQCFIGRKISSVLENHETRLHVYSALFFINGLF